MRLGSLLRPRYLPPAANTICHWFQCPPGPCCTHVLGKFQMVGKVSQPCWLLSIYFAVSWPLLPRRYMHHGCSKEDQHQGFLLAPRGRYMFDLANPSLDDVCLRYPPGSGDYWGRHPVRLQGGVGPGIKVSLPSGPSEAPPKINASGYVQ